MNKSAIQKWKNCVNVSGNLDMDMKTNDSHARLAEAWKKFMARIEAVHAQAQKISSLTKTSEK